MLQPELLCSLPDLGEPLFGCSIAREGHPERPEELHEPDLRDHLQHRKAGHSFDDVPERCARPRALAGGHPPDPLVELTEKPIHGPQCRRSRMLCKASNLGSGLTPIRLPNSRLRRAQRERWALPKPPRSPPSS